MCPAMTGEQKNEYVSFGVDGLDEMLGDTGLPRGYTVLVMGTPGVGKTIMSVQFLHHGALEHGEPGIYILLDDSQDISPIRYVEGKATERVMAYDVGRRDFELTKFRHRLENEIEEIGAKRLVVDPISIFLLRYHEEKERRFAMIDLIESMTAMGTTSLLVHELKSTSMDREHQFEEYVTQGVLVMRKAVKGSRLIRTIEIEKMRGIGHDTQPRPYRIAEGGIEIYPGETTL
jgi:circadian clock protein KaiC